MERIKIKQEFNVKVLNKLMDLRYFQQPELKELKKKLLSNYVDYKVLIDQDLRSKDNEELGEYDKMRWDRQLLHPFINQKKIRDASIVVFGCGGIGSNALIGLVYSGVHNFKIIDFDKIDYSNLNRQTLYIPSDVNRIKVDKAKERLLEINPKISIESYNMKLDYPLELNLLKTQERNYSRCIAEINEIIKWGDYIINAVDDHGAPYLINDLCIKNRKPYYWGAVNLFLGEFYSYKLNKRTACLRCIFGPTDFFNKIQFLRYRTKNDTVKGGNLGTTVISTGLFIAEFIIHDICGISNSMDGHYIIYDSNNFEIHKIPIKINYNCDCQNFLH